MNIEKIREELNKLPSISQTLKDFGFYTKKNLGQNFIFDLNVTDKIVRSAFPVENEILVEVGPGAGSLTRQILHHNPKKLYVIEKDQRCLEILEKLKAIAPDKLEIINDDALNIDYSELIEGDEKLKVISNLPYNVGTQLLMNWISAIEFFDSFTLMFQKEVADRICAKVGDKEYGRLSIISDLTCSREKLFEVPPTIFYPPPKVYSAIVHLKSKENQLSKEQVKKISSVAKHAFSQKRKSIRNSLKTAFGKEVSAVLSKAGIDEGQRAENISTAEYKKLAEFI